MAKPFAPEGVGGAPKIDSRIVMTQLHHHPFD
jgi:hypothetical protein